jgi:cytochrome b
MSIDSTSIGPGAVPGPIEASRGATAVAPGVMVWDPLVRLFHWSLAASFAVAFVLEDNWLGVHVWAGYLALGLIALRLVWGFVGTRHARFTDFVRGPRAVAAYLGDAVRMRAPRHLGHNPAGGAMVVALLTLVGATGLSGMALYGAQELSGPLAPWLGGLSPEWGEMLEGLHEILANATLALVVLHVAGVLFSGLSHGENLVAAMLTGRKRIN